MNQTYEDIIRRKLNLLDEWHNSMEYKQLRNENYTHINELVHMGEQYVPLCADMQGADFARIEITSASSLHRGFYCPSLIYDLIAGNVNRGKKLKRLTSKSKEYFIYGFDKNDRLVQCKRFYNGRLANTEYMFYESDHRYGIILDVNGRLEQVSLEKYENGKLKTYEIALVSQIGGANACMRMWKEEYEYDSLGFRVCIAQEDYPQQSFHSRARYTFDREGGCLIGYLSEDIIGIADPIVLGSNYYRLTPRQEYQGDGGDKRTVPLSLCIKS